MCSHCTWKLGVRWCGVRALEPGLGNSSWAPAVGVATSKCVCPDFPDLTYKAGGVSNLPPLNQGQCWLHAPWAPSAPSSLGAPRGQAAFGAHRCPQVPTGRGTKGKMML